MPCDTLGIKQIRAFYYPVCRIFWIGWVMKRELDPTPLYFDNTPYVTIHAPDGICYATVGLTRGEVFRRLKKFIEKEMEAD